MDTAIENIQIYPNKDWDKYDKYNDRNDPEKVLLMPSQSGLYDLFKKESFNRPYSGGIHMINMQAVSKLKGVTIDGQHDTKSNCPCPGGEANIKTGACKKGCDCPCRGIIADYGGCMYIGLENNFRAKGTIVYLKAVFSRLIAIKFFIILK